MEEELLEQTKFVIPKELMLAAVAILFVINIIAFILMAIDKKRSRHHSSGHSKNSEGQRMHKHHSHKSRIPEAVLLGLAVCGGGFGILFGMIAFHHKTNGARHSAFVNGVPIILLVELIGALIVFASMI